MSQYNSYAKRLDEAFRTAQEKTNDALAEFNKIDEEWNRTDDANEKAIMAAKRVKARVDLEQARRDAWQTFRKTRDSLERELTAEVRNAQLADPDRVDDHAVLLLNSGMLTGADLAAMAEKYADNPTMKRMIGNHARNMARDMKDPEELRKLNGVAYECNKQPEVLENWNVLRTVSEHYSAEHNDHADTGLVLKMAEHWDDDNVRDTIANF